jgi:hypothetical protein
MSHNSKFAYHLNTQNFVSDDTRFMFRVNRPLTSTAAAQVISLHSWLGNSKASGNMVPCSVSRVTGWVGEKFAQNVAQPIFLSKLIQNLSRGNKQPKNVSYFWNRPKTTQKTSTIRQKFAQTGHPVCQQQVACWRNALNWTQTKMYFLTMSRGPVFFPMYPK